MSVSASTPARWQPIRQAFAFASNASNTARHGWTIGVASDDRANSSSLSDVSVWYWPAKEQPPRQFFATRSVKRRNEEAMVRYTVASKDESYDSELSAKLEIAMTTSNDRYIEMMVSKEGKMVWSHESELNRCEVRQMQHHHYSYFFIWTQPGHFSAQQQLCQTRIYGGMSINKLSLEVHELQPLAIFQQRLKTHLFEVAYPWEMVYFCNVKCPS